MCEPPLAELSFDLQVQICEFLQPPQILALRQTSKAFHQLTSQRIVWIHALIRICHDNFLFLPTFPIHDMSIAELERAATAPFRWIALSSTMARNGNDLLQLHITRTIKTPIALGRREGPPIQVYLVPGGRYFVISDWHFFSIWDLGYVSDSDDGKLIGMWEAVDGFWGYIDFIVRPTPDGMGIRILATSSRISVTYVLYVFEIYPQQETPELVQLAKFTINQRSVSSFTYSLNGNRVVIYERIKGKFIVWDFLAETVASWSFIIQNSGKLDQIIRVTETVIIMHGTRGDLLIFEIPPLKATKVPFDINEDLPIVTPELGSVTHEYESALFQKPDSWYSGNLSSLPVCVDISHQNNSRQYKLDINVDFSTIRLVPISKVRLASIETLGQYRICDNRFVNVFDRWEAAVSSIEVDVCGGFGLSSNGQAHSLSHIRDMRFTFPLIHSRSSFCPASARFAIIVQDNIVISDFLKEGI